MYAVCHMIYVMSRMKLLLFQCCVSMTLNLFLSSQRLPDWLLILSSRTGTILVQGPGQGPQKLFITGGWQYCHMESSGYNVGLASFLKLERPHHLLDKSFQAAPKMQFLYYAWNTQDIPTGGERIWIRRMPRKLYKWFFQHPAISLVYLHCQLHTCLPNRACLS